MDFTAEVIIVNVLKDDRQMTCAEIAHECGISKSSVYAFNKAFTEEKGHYSMDSLYVY